MINSITNRQMVFILVLTLTTYTIVNIPKVMAETAGSGSWIPIIIVSVVFGLAAVVIVSLNNMFKKQMIFDYSRLLIGKAGSYLIAFYYFFYFLVICAFLLSQISILLKTDFLPKTPQWATVFAALLISGFGAYKGITNVARLLEIYGLIFVVTALVVHVFMISVGEFKQILPLYNAADMGKYLAAAKDLIFPFIGIEVLLFIPFTEKNKNAKKTAFLTMLAIGLFYILVVLSCMMVVGRKDIVYYNDALIVALRRVEAPFLQFLQRVDFLYLTVGFMANISGVTIFYIGVVEYACRIFPKMKRYIIVILVGAMIFLTYLITQNIKEYNKGFIETIIYPGLISAFFIPTLLFIIAKVKKNAGKTN